MSEGKRCAEEMSGLLRVHQDLTAGAYLLRILPKPHDGRGRVRVDVALEQHLLARLRRLISRRRAEARPVLHVHRLRLLRRAHLVRHLREKREIEAIYTQNIMSAVLYADTYI